MANRMIELSDQHGKVRARLGTSHVQVIARSRNEPVSLDKTSSVPKRKRKGWSVRQIDRIIRKCEATCYVMMAFVMFLYIVDDGYIFYGVGGWVN